MAVKDDENPNNPLINVPTSPNGHFGWVEIAGAINQGAFAVLMSEVLLFIVVKRTIKESIIKVKAFLDRIEETSVQNTRMIKELIEHERRERKKDNDTKR